VDAIAAAITKTVVPGAIPAASPNAKE
jgi:hypothetical protein